VPFVIAALALGLSVCTNPYGPVQRGLGGCALGADSGAAIGAAAGGGPGAALGAAIGGATGIFGGLHHRALNYGYPAYGYPAYGYPSYRYPAYGYPPTHSRAMDIRANRVFPVSTVPRPMDTKFRIPCLLRCAGLQFTNQLGAAGLPGVPGYEARCAVSAL
jgi:hypothetical protein